MTTSFSQLSTHDVQTLADALRTGRLAAPFSEMMVKRSVSGSLAGAAAEALNGLVERGFTGLQIATLLDALHSDRKSRKPLDELVDLVTTGPEAPGTTNRDTSVVVKDLFRQAERSVLIAGYAVYQGQQVFETLAERMVVLPDLDVKMYLDIQRGNDTSDTSIIRRRFADRFKSKQWPEGARLPAIYFDPRSLDISAGKRACLHAKCIVVDETDVFISSANFTEAAQLRNIEVGLRVSSRSIGRQLSRHFTSLVSNGDLQPVF